MKNRFQTIKIIMKMINYFSGTVMTNVRPRIGYLRQNSPRMQQQQQQASTSQIQSQSSSEYGLSRSGTTDMSETSTTDDYVTANTGTTSSLTKSSGLLPVGLSAPLSATATTADGSSFESASSIYSLARSEVCIY